MQSIYFSASLCLCFGIFFGLFRFNLGKGKAEISTDFTLVLNQWYHVEIIRVGLKGTLIVDYVQVFEGVAPGDWKNLDLLSALVYLGGGVSLNRETM